MYIFSSRFKLDKCNHDSRCFVAVLIKYQYGLYSTDNVFIKGKRKRSSIFASNYPQHVYFMLHHSRRLRLKFLPDAFPLIESRCCHLNLPRV